MGMLLFVISVYRKAGDASIQANQKTLHNKDYLIDCPVFGMVSVTIHPFFTVMLAGMSNLGV